MAGAGGGQTGAFRLLAITPLMGAAAAYRAAAGYANAWYKQSPKLVGLWFDAVEPGGDQVTAAGELRDRLLVTAQESVQSASGELERGIDDLRHFSRPR